jgi:uncharacterized RDD family membrane protein YckC
MIAMTDSISTPITAPLTTPFAGPLRQLMAVMYDSFLLLGVLFVATLIPALLQNLLKPMQGETIHDLPPLFEGWQFTLYLVFITLLFFSYFWRKNGQTLGMQSWGLKVVSVDGGKPSWKQCVLRGITAIFSLVLVGAGYLWVLIDKDHCSWHDRISNTRVVLMPKKR